MHASLEGYLKHVEAGHIRMVTWDDLVLFNYTDQATFDKVWNEYTLNARGHIFHKDTGEVVARPFGKFFNYNEHEGIYGKEVLDGLLKKTHYIQQKADGSLGVVFWWKGEWRVATRGSFSSEQAIRGQEILKKYNMPASGDGWTYLAEIIYPENRIIVPYGDVEKLVLLAARDNSTGQYSNALETIAAKFGMPLVQQEQITIAHALQQQKHIPYTEEGWVVVFDCGTRLKIKGDDYMRIAKFKANLSPLAVWEALLLGSYTEMAVAAPEECRDELEFIQGKLQADFSALKEFIDGEWASLDLNRSRKDIALDIQQKPKWIQGALFGKLSKSPNEAYLWKLLRPDGNVYAKILDETVG